MHRLFICASFACLMTLVGCVTTNDLNKPCKLVKGNPDGGAQAIDLLKTDDIIRNSANKDFISFGSTDCEDQICVRDAAFVDDPADTDPVAKGYCSDDCGGPGDDMACNSSLATTTSTALTCRALLLDADTLAAIKMSEPGEYSTTFGMATSPFFCARSAVVIDAGM